MNYNTVIKMIIKTETIGKPLGDSNKKQDIKLYIQNDFKNDKWSKGKFTQRK